MATITEIQLQDGSVHQIGGGQTYTLSKSGNTITLTGSGGGTSSVTDDNTTYSFSVSGNTMTITPSSGSPQTITLPDNDTTYTFSISGDTLTITPSNGTPQTITLPSLKYTKDATDLPSKTNNVVQNDVANNVADGGYSLAEGIETTASGRGSHAEGYDTTASGNYSHAEGHLTQATALNSHAEGELTEASGLDSHAEGVSTKASSNRDHAEGYYTIASGGNSHAEGQESKAQGGNSHAEGYDTTASGGNSHAEGYRTVASQLDAHAEGESTTASGKYSHAEGSYTTASNNDAHAEGYGATASGLHSHAQNEFTKASKRSQTTIGTYNVEDTSATTTHPSGTTAYGQYAFIIGNGSNNNPSNAMTVEWDGDLETAGDVIDGQGNVLANMADATYVNNQFSAINHNIPYVPQTNTQREVDLTGTTNELTSLTEGQSIVYHFYYQSNTNATLNLTLADGTTTGAIDVYYLGTTRLTTHCAAGSDYRLTYHENVPINGSGSYTGWWVEGNYDANTNTIGYQLRTNSSTLPMADTTYRYRVFFTSADGSKFVPSTTSTSTNATSARSVNQRPIDPFGQIVYYSATTVVNANATPSATAIWQQYTMTFGYAFNRQGSALTLTYPAPIYIKCTPQADGSAIIDPNTPYVQSLPTTEDGKIYIFLGRAYSATAVEVIASHPVYYYSDGAIRLWTNAKSGTTYPSMTQADAETGTSTTDSVITPKVLHDVIESLDDNTTYTFSLSGNILTITPSNGSPQTITLPDEDTTYSMSISGNTLTLTGSDGSTSTVTVATTDTTYALSKSGSTITLTGSDGSTSSVTDSNTTYTISASGDTITLTGSDGSTDTATIADNDTTYTFSISGNVLTITPSSGSPQTVTLPDEDTTYTLSISGSTVTLTGSDGSTDSVTVPNTTYTISKSGSTVTLTGSDGSTSTFTDSDTTYPSMTQAQGEAGTSTTDSVITPKVLHDVISSLDEDTTYTISISGNVLTLTPSSGTAQTVTLPNDDTTYSISASGDTITLTGSDGSTSTATVADDNTTYTISISGHTITLTPSAGTAQTITVPDDNTTYTISRSGGTVTLTGSDGSTSTFSVPTALADLTSDSTHRVVTDTQIAEWDSNSPQNIWYGTSATAAATAAKVASTSSGDFVLAVGNMVRVKFTNAQTYNGTATLNVDGTGAVNIARVGTTLTTRYYWTAGEVVDLVYDGTNFVMSDKGTASTTYYGLTKLSSSTSSTSTALAATASAVKSAYDLADSKVSDVQVNGTSVVTNGVAEITLPSSEEEVFIADFAVATYSDLVDAIDDGKIIAVKFGNTQYLTITYSTYYADRVVLESIVGSGSLQRYEISTSDVWTVDTQLLQEQLESGTNIKTVNNQSLLGSGNISISGGVTDVEVNGTSVVTGGVADITLATVATTGDYGDLTNKPTIPTVPNPSSTTPLMDGTASVGTETNYARGNHRHPTDTSRQATLVSGTNIKTINGNSVLGSGDLTVGGSVTSTDVPTADTIAEFDSTAHMNSTDMTTGSGGEVEDFISGLNFSGASILDMFYPVGSYYETSDTSFDPTTAWGGTWELETGGQVHVSSGSNYAVSGALTNTTDGGETTHLLTGAESGQKGLTITGGTHTHTLKVSENYANGGSNRNLPRSAGNMTSDYGMTTGSHTHSVSASNASSAHNNMQPYIVVNRWHRTA